jgi:hypothetical protein
MLSMNEEGRHRLRFEKHLHSTKRAFTYWYILGHGEESSLDSGYLIYLT